MARNFLGGPPRKSVFIGVYFCSKNAIFTIIFPKIPSLYDFFKGIFGAVGHRENFYIRGWGGEVGTLLFFLDFGEHPLLVKVYTFTS